MLRDKIKAEKRMKNMENITSMENMEIKKSKDKNNKKINNKKTNNHKNNHKYSFIKVFNYVLINAFRLILLFLLIASIFKGDKEHTFLIALCSITSFYKELIYLFTKIRISIVMQIVFTTFLILTILIGTLMQVYDKIPWWDTMLHGVSGILLIISSLMVLAMMGDKNKNLKYSVGLVVSYAFFFAMAAGTIWELLEFTGDSFFRNECTKSKRCRVWCFRYNAGYCCKYSRFFNWLYSIVCYTNKKVS